jgi:hypothetical protein
MSCMQSRVSGSQSRSKPCWSQKQASAVAHQCSLCEKQFCSKNAMLQHHRNAPSHNTMFKCDKRGKHCRSRQGLDDHQRTLGHTATGSLVIFVPTGWSKGTSSRGFGLAGRLQLNSNTRQLMDMQLDEDWSLCDKDCGWCGHCADTYFY